jgi:hypothetical protein
LQNRIPYVYVAATSFSGTTLLGLLLDTHPRIVSVGEVDNIIPRDLQVSGADAYLCSCGQPIRRCDFFAQIRARCLEQGVELDLHDFRTHLGTDWPLTVRRLVFGPARRAVWLERARDALLPWVPTYRRHVDQVVERNLAIARAALEASGKDVFLDTSKSVSRVPHLHRHPEVDLRVIHVIRDVRAFAFSALRHGNRKESADAGRVWVRTHTAAARLRHLVGDDRYLRLRWEDFCVRPDAVLDQLCRFLGVEPVELVAAVNERTHHVIGNQMRLKPVRPIRSDESWREALAPDQRAACERVAGDLSRRFGYA